MGLGGLPALSRPPSRPGHIRRTMNYSMYHDGVVQCLECGAYYNVSDRYQAKIWAENHLDTCEGDPFEEEGLEE